MNRGDKRKKCEELELARRLFRRLGYSEFCVEPGPERPDVIVTFDHRRIGIEVTQFHADRDTGKKGSQLRAYEKGRTRRAPDCAYSMSVPVDPIHGLCRAIDNKVRLAAQYSTDKRYDELWLLVASQLPQLGATASTFALQLCLPLEVLNAAVHNPLLQSRFRAAYLHLLLENTVYEWSPSGMWRIVASSQSDSPPTRGLWFQQVFNDPEWLENPTEKARQEAQKAIDEISSRRCEEER